MSLGGGAFVGHLGAYVVGIAQNMHRPSPICDFGSRYRASFMWSNSRSIYRFRLVVWGTWRSEFPSRVSADCESHGVLCLARPGFGRMRPSPPYVQPWRKRKTQQIGCVHGHVKCDTTRHTAASSRCVYGAVCERWASFLRTALPSSTY